MQVIAILTTAVALKSSMEILPKMGWRQAQVVYMLDPIFLGAGDKVILNGCMEVTNNSGFAVGWGIGIKEMTSNAFVSPRQSRNVTPKMHHDSLGVTGYFRAKENGDYQFALTSWCGSTHADGSSLKIEVGKDQSHSAYGQLIAQVIR